MALQPSDLTQPILERHLDCIKPDGCSGRIHVALFPPYFDGQSYRCRITISGLDYEYTPPHISGWDGFQTCLFAISLVRGLLDDFTSRGGKLFYPDSNIAFDNLDFW
jgi:hypothetical protein